ncbi:MAG: TlpA disulfide reductase family protein [Pirellulaceae bacterium]
MCASAFLLLTSALAAGPIEAGTQLTYRGAMIAEKGDPVLTRKNFELQLTVVEFGDAGAELLWTLSEEGRGGWAWPDRFGRLQLDANLRAEGDRGPSLLYERPEGLSIVNLLAPLVAAEAPLKKGFEWRVDRLLHKVEDSASKKDIAAWRVTAGTLYGVKRTLWIDKQSPRVVAMHENVTIGQGERHDLEMELVSEKTLTDDELRKVDRAFTEMEALRDKLEQPPRTPRVVWSEEQIALLRDKLEPIVALAADTPLAAVAADAAGDAKDQKNRANAVGALAKRIIGQPAPAFELSTLDRKTVDSADLKGKVVVLHFWEYRDTPLEEPYGQVGYLDFLHRRHAADKVAVFGVNVDERLAAEFTRGKSIAAAKKLKSFMNLGFPVLLDDGALLKQFGDPRVTGAKLPVFVVIGADGAVTHYHVGFYDVDRDAGLKELEQAVTAAAETSE